MPWWGWLIAAGVALLVLGWIVVAAIGAITARGMSKDMNRRFDDFRGRYGR